MIENRENEAALLGAVMRDATQFDALSDIITPDDFGWGAYGAAWKAMLSLRERSMGIDVITVGDELERVNGLSEFSTDDGRLSGRIALTRIRENGDPRNAETYAAKVLDYSAKRQVLDLMSTGATWSNNGRTAHDIISDLSVRLGKIRTFDHKSASHTQTIAEAVSSAYDHTDAASQGKIVFVPTGYIDLDNILAGGMTAPDLYVVAARPGQGKTALLVSIAHNVAKQKKHVAIFSLEMMNKQIAMRLLAQESGVGYDKQKSGKLQDRDWPLYTHGVETVAALPITLNDMPDISVSRMRQELRRMKDVSLIVVDYLQLGGVDGKYDRRDQEIGEITRGLKSIAKEFDIPVLAAAQLSRAVEQRSEKRPVLSDLRESGSIENDADVVMFIYRPDQYEKDTNKQNIAEIIVAKHRNGAVGTVELMYRPTITKFENAVTKIFRPNESEM